MFDVPVDIGRGQGVDQRRFRFWRGTARQRFGSRQSKRQRTIAREALCEFGFGLESSSRTEIARAAASATRAAAALQRASKRGETPRRSRSATTPRRHAAERVRALCSFITKRLNAEHVVAPCRVKRLGCFFADCEAFILERSINWSIDSLANSIAKPHGSAIRRRIGSTDSVNAAGHLGLANSVRGAVLDVPTARVDHQQRAVGVLDHVGGTKMRIGARQQRRIHGPVRAADRFELVSRNAAGVELRRDEAILILAAKRRRSQSRQAAQGHGGIQSREPVAVRRSREAAACRRPGLTDRSRRARGATASRAMPATGC